MSYKIELIPSGVAGARDTMFRGGLKFELGTPQILDLTEEQAEVFKNDWRFKVSNSTDSSQEIAGGATPESKAISSTSDSLAEEEPVAEVETVKDSAVTPQKATSGKSSPAYSVEELLKDYSRSELDSLAFDMNIKYPESFNNKTEVAQAIVDAQ